MVREFTTRVLNGTIAVRELKRAIDAELLVAEERGTGRGHGARVISPTAMVAYLTMRARTLVLSHAKRPKKFNQVVKAGSDAF